MRVSGRVNLKKTVKIVGNILMAVSIIYIALFIVHAQVEWERYISLKNIVLIVLAGAFNSTGILLLAAAWRENLHIFSDKIPGFRSIAGVYCKANLARYIPGNIIHIATRNMLGVQYGLKQLEMLFSSAIEIGLQIITGVFCIVLLSFPFLQALFDRYMTGWIMWLIAGAITVIALAFFMFRKGLAKYNIRFLWRSAMYCLGFETVNLISFLFVLALMDISMPAGSLREMGGYYMLSWLAGMVTPGAPGGMGVREYILLKLSGNRLNQESIIIIMIFMRIVTIAGDIAAYLISAVAGRRREA